METHNVATFDFVHSGVNDRCQMLSSARGGKEQTEGESSSRTSAKEGLQVRRGGFQGWIVHAERGSSFASPNRLTVSSSGPALGHCVHARSASRKPGEITNVSAPRCRPAAWCPLELGARRRPLLWQQCGRQGQYGAVRGGEGVGKGSLSSPAWPGPRMLAVTGPAAP